MYKSEQMNAFLDRLVFVVEQPDLSDRIKKEIGNEFNLINDITYNSFRQYMSEWMQKREIKPERAVFLTHEDMKTFWRTQEKKLLH